MKLLVGLGNPGPQYTNTRHNAGFMVVDRVVHAAGGATPKSRFAALTFDVEIAGEKCVVMKPLTFMNRSGQAVGEALRFYKLSPASDLLVIVDDLYLPTGSVRVRASGGAGGHNGLANIQQLLGTEEYPRLRVGVGLQPSGGKPALMDQADFVLGKFTPDESTLLEASVQKAAESARVFVAKGIQAAMNAMGPPARNGNPNPPSTSPPSTSPPPKQ